MEKRKELNTGRIIIVLIIISIIVHFLVPPYQRTYEPASAAIVEVETLDE